MTGNPLFVLWAIQAGVRLYASGRKAYVEATLNRPLVLPLPRGPGINSASALNFFKSDPQGIVIAGREENVRIRALLDSAMAATLKPEEEDELKQIYAAYLAELHPEAFERPVSSEEPRGHEIVAMMTVRQWSKGELGDHPSALQSVAGTLVNVAVDYFVHMPDAISLHRPTGRALKACLEAMDDLDFAKAPPAEIASDLLMAVVDSVGAHPDLIGNTQTEKKLVRNITISLSEYAKTHLEDAPTEVRWEGSAWLKMIARALIKGGTSTVLTAPNTLLGFGKTESKIIQEVGGTIADLLIGPDRLRFQALLSGEGVNTVIKAALRATAKNPGILKVDNQGLRNIIVGVADGLSEQPNVLVYGDLFPEILRLVLENSADNLDLVWPRGTNDIADHLLITGTRELFNALADGTYGEDWPTLNQSQIMGIVEVVFDEIIENPQWLLQSVGHEHDSALSVALKASLESLGQLKAPLLSADAAVTAISTAIRASAMCAELLQELPPGGANAGEIALRAAMDALFQNAMGDHLRAKEKWIRSRRSILKVALEVSLEKLARHGAEQKHIDVLRAEIGGLIDQRLTVDDLGNRLESLLKAA